MPKLADDAPKKCSRPDCGKKYTDPVHNPFSADFNESGHLFYSNRQADIARRQSELNKERNSGTW